ncbi:MAG: PKD domain-containing protein [Bacteroidota bacterium]
MKDKLSFLFVFGILIILPRLSQAQTCDDIFNVGVQGSAILSSELCALPGDPQTVIIRASFGINPAFAAFDPDLLSFEFHWNDAGNTVTTLTFAAGDLTETFTNLFEGQAQFDYPPGADCFYEPVVFPTYDGQACGTGNPNNLSAFDQTQIVLSYSTDDSNGGNVALDPAIEEVCVNTDFNVIFNDATEFNCNVAQEPNVPNQRQRWVRFVYGDVVTGAGARIPNVFVGGVQVTMADGTFNPAPPVNGQPYVDPRGAIIYPAAVLPAVQVANEATLDIAMISADEEIGDIFVVTVQNWNVCNPFDDGVAPAPGPDGDNDPIEATSLIEIIGPIDPTNPIGNVYCEGDPIPPIFVDDPGPPTVVNWFDAPVGGNLVGTGVPFTPPGPGTYYAEYDDGCTSDNRTPVTLIENPLPTDVNVISNADDICFNESVDITVQNTQVGIQYQLRNNANDANIGAPIVGNGADQVIFSGNLTNDITYNVLATNLTTFCDVELSDRPAITVNPDLQITAGVVTSPICAEEDIQLTSNVTGGSGSFTFNWTGPNGFTSTDEDPVIPMATVAATGVYTVTVTDAFTSDLTGNCTATDNINVVVDPLPTQANAGTPQAGCFDQVTDFPASFTLNGNAAAAGEQGTWSVFSGPGTANFTNVNDENTDVTINAPIDAGLYRLIWRIENTTTNCFTTDTVEVDFGVAPPAAAAGNDQDICGLTSALAGNAPGVAATGTWTIIATPAGGSLDITDINDPTSAVALDASEVYGSYTLRWTLSSGTCPVETDDVVLLFNEEPIADAGADFLVCETDQILLNATFSGSATSGAWSGGLGSFSNSNDPNAEYFPDAAEVGSTVTLTFTTNDPDGAGGCPRGVSTVDITITALPVADAGANQLVCEGDVITLNGMVSGSASSGTWSGGLGSFTDPTVLNTIYTPDPTEVGTAVTLILTTNDPDGAGGCTPAASTTEITITPLPIINAGNDTILCEGDPIILQGSIGGSATMGTWSGGAGAFSNVNDVNAQYFPDAAEIGTTITLTFQTDDPDGAGGCAPEVDQVDVTINPQAAANPVGPTTINIAAGTATPAGALDITLGGSATNGMWEVHSATTGGIFAPDPFSLNPTFDPSNAQDNDGQVILRFVTNDPVGPCPRDTAFFTIDILGNPSADAASPINECEAPTITLTGTVDGTATSGNWEYVSGGGGGGSITTTVGPGPNPRTVTGLYTLDPLDPGNTLIFRLVTNDPDGPGPVQRDTAIVSVNVIPLPNTTPIAGGGLTDVCEGTTGQFYSVNLNPSNEYLWTLSPGTQGTEFDVSAGTLGSFQLNGNFVALDFNTAGVYTLEVTERTSTPVVCEAPSISINITVYTQHTVEAGDSTAVCAGTVVSLGGNAASGGNTANGGSGNFSYFWSPPLAGLDDPSAANPNATPTSSTTYTVTVADNISNCPPVSDQVPITVSAVTNSAFVGALFVPGNQIDLQCNGDTNGEGKFVAAGGLALPTESYNFNIIQGNGATFNQVGNELFFTDSGPGQIIVEVQDLNSAGLMCSETQVIDIIEPPAINVTTAVTSDFNGSDVTCVGASDGQITASASGGTGALVYSINGGVTFQTDSIFNGLNAGTYIVRIRDANGCETDAAPIDINDPAPLTITTAISQFYNGSEISCVGAIDGEVTATAAGGTGALRFSINGGITFQNSPVFPNLIAGTYTVRVQDQNGCETDAAPITLSDPPALNVNATVTSFFNGAEISCFGASDGEITAAGSGGTGAYEYSLDGTNFQPSDIFAGLPSGSYNVTIRDANSCESISNQVTIDDPPQVFVNAMVTSDFNGSDVSCFGASDGEITIMGSGGTGALEFSLDGIIFFPNTVLTGLPAGTYMIFARDINLCPAATVSVTIQDPPQIMVNSIITSNFNGVDISCFGAADGEIQAQVTGGTGQYTYELNGPTGQELVTRFGASQTFFALVDGSYTVQVRDENNCPSNINNVTLVEPPELVLTSFVPTPFLGNELSCVDAEDGSVDASVVGGTGDYTFFLSGTRSDDVTKTAATHAFEDLPGGIYNVTVVDQNNCVSNRETHNIAGPPPLLGGLVDSDQVICPNDDPFQLNSLVDASGGVGEYNYQWEESFDNFNFVPISGATNLTFDPPPTAQRVFYRRRVNDGPLGTCDDVFSNVITIEISPQPQATVAGSTTICRGDVTVVGITVTTGFPPYSITYRETNSLGSNLITQDGLGANTQIVVNPDETTTYELVSVTDAGGAGCTNDSFVGELATIVVEDPIADFTINGSKNPVQVLLDETGQREITIENNAIDPDPNFTYTYDFDDGNFFQNERSATFTYIYTTASPRDSDGFEVTLTVTSPSGQCIAEETIIIDISPISPTVIAMADTTRGCVPLTINFDGTESFNVDFSSFFWDFGEPGEPIANGVRVTHTYTLPGMYRVVLFGSNGEETATDPTRPPNALNFDQDTIFIEVFETPTAFFLPLPNPVFITDQDATNQVFRPSNQSIGATEFEWDFGDGGTSTDIFPEHFYEIPGNYDVTLAAINDDGCTDTYIDRVSVQEGGAIRIPNAFTPSIGGPPPGFDGRGGATASDFASNDVFLPLLNGVDDSDYSLLIFDRWGNLLFESNDPDVGWTGYDENGQLLPAGVYVFRVKARLVTGEFVNRIGDVTLLR